MVLGAGGGAALFLDVDSFFIAMSFSRERRCPRSRISCPCVLSLCASFFSLSLRIPCPVLAPFFLFRSLLAVPPIDFPAVAFLAVSFVSPFLCLGGFSCIFFPFPVPAHDSSRVLRLSISFPVESVDFPVPLLVSFTCVAIRSCSCSLYFVFGDLDRLLFDDPMVSPPCPVPPGLLSLLIFLLQSQLTRSALVLSGEAVFRALGYGYTSAWAF